MKDNEFRALMLGRVLKRDNKDTGTGLMIKLDGHGGAVEKTYNVETGRAIGTRHIDHVDIAVLELDGWTILPNTTPF